MIQLTSLWNKSTTNIVSSGCACSKLIFPSLVFCPWKPYLLENEYHTILCDIFGIFLPMETVESFHCPLIPKDNINEKSDTIGVLLHLWKSLCNGGCVVVLDSGFCVLSGPIKLRKLRVYTAVVIKKRRHWLKYVLGVAMDAKMESILVRKTNCTSDKLDYID